MKELELKNGTKLSISDEDWAKIKQTAKDSEELLPFPDAGIDIIEFSNRTAIRKNKVGYVLSLNGTRVQLQEGRVLIASRVKGIKKTKWADLMIGEPYIATPYRKEIEDYDFEIKVNDKEGAYFSGDRRDVGFIDNSNDKDTTYYRIVLEEQ